jgi:hypothetical protein
MRTADGSADRSRAANVDVVQLDNNSLIIRLHFTINHLSRWLTPIHDRTKLTRGLRWGEPSVKDLLIKLRDEELRVFPMMHLIANQNNPDLDKLVVQPRTPAEAAWDREADPIIILGEFRRLRQSSCSLLRGLPDSAWARVGTSRRTHDWQIRSLAEQLAVHDVLVLSQIDETLDRINAREGIGVAHRVHLDELLRLVPVGRR